MRTNDKPYYCIAFRFWGIAFCGVFDTPTELADEIAKLYELFDTPSQMDTCSVRAQDKQKAYDKAVEYFNNNGWNIEGLE